MNITLTVFHWTIARIQVDLADLYWISESVANILHRNGIHTRDELAKRLDIRRATIYRNFNADWSGRATMVVLVRAAAVFKVSLGALVKEPAWATR